jgi:hypothetical protein
LGGVPLARNDSRNKFSHLLKNTKPPEDDFIGMVSGSGNGYGYGRQIRGNILDDTQRYVYGLKFENAFLREHGKAFEILFAWIMAYALPIAR